MIFLKRTYIRNKLWQLNDALMCRQTTSYKNVQRTKTDDNRWEVYESK